MRGRVGTLLLTALMVLASARIAEGQRMRFPSTGPAVGSLSSGPVFPPSNGQPAMVPLNGLGQPSAIPSVSSMAAPYDPYAGVAPSASLFPAPTTLGPSSAPYLGNPPTTSNIVPGWNTPAPTGGFQGASPFNGLNQPSLPGAGISGSMGIFPGNLQNGYPPGGLYPQSTPPALFPNGLANGGAIGSGPILGNLFGNSSNNWAGAWGAPSGAYNPPNAVGGTGFGTWNPPGTIFSGGTAYPSIMRLFQGPRFRHTWIAGSEDADSLQVNDADVALAFGIPNFLFSTQPLYLLPSFSLHSWDGPATPSGADLPALAYSAFLDSGWQSESARILGAELALRVGMFSDFNTATSESLRIMGRGLGRLRLTPSAMLKLGVIYYDRNSLKLLPAGGLLWQPDPLTRFDIFFPEPKLAHYLTTIGRFDTWWYVGGYYGGGSWTIERASGATDSIDLNDIRLLLGFEWGRNEQIRDGRRVGFFEVGYVFKRELEFKYDPVDNIDLQDSLFLRAGFGY